MVFVALGLALAACSPYSYLNKNPRVLTTRTEKPPGAAVAGDASDLDPRANEQRNGRSRFNLRFGGSATAGTGSAFVPGDHWGSYSGSDGCSSDFDCSMGQACVKPVGSARGTCMDAVDENGHRDVTRMPGIDSVGPNFDPDCHVSAECPPSFRCSRGNCVR